MAEFDTPTGDEVQRWLEKRRVDDGERFTPRHKSAEVVAQVVSVAMAFVRDEAAILGNVPRLPQILREQLRQPSQKWGFAGVVVISAAQSGLATWMFVANPVPGVILGSYLAFRKAIAKSVFE